MNKNRKEFLEQVRNYYRTTASGRKVRWDEPERDDDPQVQKDNAYFSKMLKQKKQQQTSRERLKSTDKIPKKAGKPMWEQYGMVEEDFNRFISTFRKYYYSSKSMRFKDWLDAMEELVEVL